MGGKSAQGDKRLRLGIRKWGKSDGGRGSGCEKQQRAKEGVLWWQEKVVRWEAQADSEREAE